MHCYRGKGDAGFNLSSNLIFADPLLFPIQIYSPRSHQHDITFHFLLPSLKNYIEEYRVTLPDKGPI